MKTTINNILEKRKALEEKPIVPLMDKINYLTPTSKILRIYNVLDVEDALETIKRIKSRLKKHIKPYDCISEDFDWDISALDLLKEIDKIIKEEVGDLND